MLNRRQLFGLGVIGTTASGSISPGWAALLSTPAKGQAPQPDAQLIDGGRPSSSSQELLAGIAIDLPGGALTYWRTPGEAGLPPTADFSRSTNLRGATLLFPAPGRFDEAGAEAYGYKGEVVFPIRVVPLDPAAPVDLRLDLSYAICTTLCLPASAKLALRLGDGTAADVARVQAALSRVPRPVSIGSDGPLAVAAISKESADRALVTVRTPAGSSPDLFAEAPDGWALTTRRTEATSDGQARFALAVVARPANTMGWPPSLTLTLVTADDAVESAVPLDAGQPNP